MSALDTVTGSFVPDYLSGTLSSGLPPVYEVPFTSNYSGTSIQPQVANEPRSPPGLTLTGAIDAISATALSGLNLWGKAQQINMSAASQKTSGQIELTKLDLARDVAVGQIDLARVRLDTDSRIEKIRAVGSVENANRAVVDARGGKIAQAAPNLFMIGSIIAALLYASKKA